MNTKNLNGITIWKRFEDLMIPHLHLSLIDRAVYSHLLRHSRFEGKLQLHFSIRWLADGAGLCMWSARKAVRRLVDKGALRLLDRGRDGHVVAVLLPGEIGSLRARKRTTHAAVRIPAVPNLEEVDFLGSQARRQAIHSRDGGFCFYCLCRLTPAVQCLDHVIPRARSGPNSYRNLVSSCSDCNSRKGECRAEDFLRSLYSEGRLTAAELTTRLGALRKLAAGKLRPRLPREGNTGKKGDVHHARARLQGLRGPCSKVPASTKGSSSEP